MADRVGCARISDQPLEATAPTLARWIAVERPGAWGPDAVDEERLGRGPARHLRDLSRRLEARVVLIRRHGGGGGRPRQVLVGAAREVDPWLERLRVDGLSSLPGLDLSPLGEGRSVGGRRLRRPRYLVCTHGSHDPCCAELGRPVAAAVTRAVGDRAWESSHVGGHRFAGNLVVLPHGVYYGRLTPETAEEVVAAHEAGRIALDHYRGRVCWRHPVQAAEAFLRRELEEDRLDAVTVEAVVPPRGNVHVVVLTVAGAGRLEVAVAARVLVRPQRLSCRGTDEAHPEVFDLVEIRGSGRLVRAGTQPDG